MWLAPFEEVNRTIMVDADRWYREMFEASTVAAIARMAGRIGRMDVFRFTRWRKNSAPPQGGTKGAYAVG